MPNYWTVEIPYQRVFGADNVLYEGVGIPPTKIVPDMEIALTQSNNGNSPKNHDAAPLAVSCAAFDPCVRKAIDHIINV